MLRFFFVLFFGVGGYLMNSQVVAAPVSPKVLPGIDVFLQGYTSMVRGRRAGLVTNQTGRTAAGLSSIDALAAHPDVSLIRLFSPEHGIRGKVKAGEQVSDDWDERTGLPIVSLYGGRDHRPPPESIRDLDVLFYDIQDVGSRAYTYIWTLAELMAAAGENNKTVIVLDRPNPNGCLQMDGPITEDRWRSFLGLYPIPRLYGLTVGELSRFFNQCLKIPCRLIVIPMAGYRRSMTWKQTGLVWTPPSPNIPSAESAICFAATGTIGTLGTVDIGIGTSWPFQVVGGPWLDAKAMAQNMNARHLPGVRFEPVSFSRSGKHVHAVFLAVTKPALFLPSTTEVNLLQYLQKNYPKQLKWPSDRKNSFDKATGVSWVRQMLQQGRSATVITQTWQPEIERFRAATRAFRIYH